MSEESGVAPVSITREMRLIGVLMATKLSPKPLHVLFITRQWVHPECMETHTRVTTGKNTDFIGSCTSSPGFVSRHQQTPTFKQQLMIIGCYMSSLRPKFLIYSLTPYLHLIFKYLAQIFSDCCVSVMAFTI